MSTLAVISARAGLGATTLTAHLAWMFAERGVSVLAVDFDPQASLTSLLLPEPRIDALIAARQTLLSPLSSPDEPPPLEPISAHLHLLAGDLRLIRWEEPLAESWSKGGTEGPATIASLIQAAAQQANASMILLDPGPHLGALTRAALLASDHLLLPLSPHRASLQGLENLGVSLQRWRHDWLQRVGPHPANLPAGDLHALGYVVMHPTQANGPWTQQLSRCYREALLPDAPPSTPAPLALADLKHYRSLLPLAVAAQKPMFLLKPADGARGAHVDAVRTCYADFLGLARRIGDTMGVEVP